MSGPPPGHPIPNRPGARSLRLGPSFPPSANPTPAAESHRPANAPRQLVPCEPSSFRRQSADSFSGSQLELELYVLRSDHQRKVDLADRTRKRVAELEQELADVSRERDRLAAEIAAARVS